VEKASYQARAHATETAVVHGPAFTPVAISLLLSLPLVVPMLLALVGIAAPARPGIAGQHDFW